MFKPNWLLKSVYHLTVDKLNKQNIKGILVDLDNTIVAWNNPYGSEELKLWLEDMKQNNIKVIIVSNNTNTRVEKVANVLNVPFVANAKKPTSIGLKKAYQRLNLPKENVVMIGDQLMTDILGGYRFGIRTILVKPLVDSDLLATKLNRIVEKIYMKIYRKKYNLEWRETIDE